ncbi:hypothetical protein BOSEA31B_13458 [Hyphomicrobiales bacterium]|nr:hypothetical protein BOSEA31B_13458 [Hyphomicrobiales bacterium]CAH1699229.1 hypothetical protein BOSEA1005_12282 [Hyphomicrobiales bacterium]CAI0343016.1 hypothetical protein BO1005MUT1_210081 [Hyphomicrobiales bacterium]
MSPALGSVNRNQNSIPILKFRVELDSSYATAFAAARRRNGRADRKIDTARERQTGRTS